MIRPLPLLLLLVSLPAAAEEDWSWLSGPKGVQGYAADSVNGDDQGGANTCAVTLSRDLSKVKKGTPCATVERLTTVVSGLSSAADMYLACGGSWRSMIVTDTAWAHNVPDHSTVQAYGACTGSNPPVLDGADVLAAGSWTKTAGRTNVYQIDVSTAGITTGHSAWGLRIWEDYVPHGAAVGRLRRVADVATCDSTPGSWYGPTRPPVGGTMTIYVHATDNSNPANSGRVYEWPARPYGIMGGQLQSGTSHIDLISGIETRRHAHDTGGIATAKVARNITVDTGGRDSLGTGTTGSPTHDLWDMGEVDGYHGGLVISYGDGEPAMVLRNAVIDCSWTSGITDLTGTVTETALFGHASGTGDPLKYQTQRTYENITVRNCATVMGGSSVRKVAFINVTAEDSNISWGAITDFTEAWVVGGTFKRQSEVASNNGIVFNSTAGTAKVYGIRACKKGGVFVLGSTAFSGALDVQGSSFGYVSGLSSAFHNGVSMTDATNGGITYKRNLNSGGSQCIALTGANARDIDYNLWDGATGMCNDFKYNGTSYTWTNWIGAQAQDPHSYREALTLTGDLASACTFLPSNAHASDRGADGYGDAQLDTWKAAARAAP